MTNKINFHEIDKNGNHVMRLVGGDQEHRINLMTASEDMYEALRHVELYFALAESLGIPDHTTISNIISKLLARAGGRDEIDRNEEGSCYEYQTSN